MNLPAVGRDRSVGQIDPVGSEVGDPAEADDILDAPQARQLSLAHCGAPVRGRLDRTVQADQIVDRDQPRTRLGVKRPDMGGRIDGLRYLASTTRLRTRTVVASPVSRETNRCSPRAALT